VVQPIEEIGALACEKGALFHVDATYAVGKAAIHFDDMPIDYLTFSGDRIHSLPGTGALVGRRGRPLVPLILGGGGLRGGALDLTALSAFAAASSQASLSMDLMSLETARLRDRLEEKLSALGAIPLFQDQLRLPNTSVLLFPKTHAEALRYLLQCKNVHASVGGGASPHLCKVLAASGVSDLSAETALSFSLSRYTTEVEIDRAIEAIRESLQTLHPLTADLFE
jgi:cysteine desulfurase